MKFKDLGKTARWVLRHHKASCCFLPELNGPHVPHEPASMPEACTEHNRQTPLGISSSPISSPCSTSGPARQLVGGAPQPLVDGALGLGEEREQLRCHQAQGQREEQAPRGRQPPHPRAAQHFPRAANYHPRAAVGRHHPPHPQAARHPQARPNAPSFGSSPAQC